MYRYPSFFASAFANVLLPQALHPSIVIMIAIAQKWFKNEEEQKKKFG
jgi:hypothetical protein